MSVSSAKNPFCHSEHIRFAQCKLREESHRKRGSFTAFRMTEMSVILSVSEESHKKSDACDLKFIILNVFYPQIFLSAFLKADTFLNSGLYPKFPAPRF